MIGDVPIFGLLDDEEREALAQLMDCRDFKAGENIFHYGDAGGEIFILRSGRVELFIESTEGTKIVLSENETGDVIGELSFLDGGARTGTAMAIEETQMLVMHRDRLLEFIDKHPHAAMDLLTAVGRRLRATDELLRTQVSRKPESGRRRDADFWPAHCGQSSFFRRLLDFYHHLRRDTCCLGHSELDGATQRPL
jgi:CRP/FNR family transcriptional regulator, cyclic AMP receptor protein